jgi:hypothetical protein
LARHGGGFKSDKRRKELLRLQKQEEKRQRRFSGKINKETDTDEQDNGELIVEESTSEDNTQDVE